MAATNDAGKKYLIGGLSQDFFYSLAHALRFCVDCMKNMLAVKKFKHVLPGDAANDPIEKRICINRCLAGGNVTLDVASFCTN